MLCPEPADAADVFQQVCLELYQRLPQLRDAQSLPKWLITVTRRKSVDVVRRWPRTTELAEDEFHSDQKLKLCNVIMNWNRLWISCRTAPDNCSFTSISVKNL